MVTEKDHLVYYDITQKCISYRDTAYLKNTMIWETIYRYSNL